MSVEIPKAAVVFGSVTPPQGDIIDLKVHLGCTKEVSSFECLLENWNKKYSPGGGAPINVGMDGHIDIGRGTNVPQIITCRVEKVQCESPTPNEHYILVSGRGWGERIFRRVVTKVYENKKGEDIVRDLVDYYIGLDHCRENSALTSDASSGQKDCVVADGSKFSAGMLVKIKDDNAWEYNEVSSVVGNTVTMVNNLANNYTVAANGKVWIDLIEKTDTTFTLLEYENTPVFDILKYIAESVDKSGVIGYDFRVVPDAKFEFFPKNSKTSPVSLSEKIEVSKYTKDIHRVRNKIMIYGLADKSVPLDKYAWNESLTPADGAWSGVSGDVSLDTSFKARGTASIKLHAPSLYYGSCMFTLDTGKEVNTNLYPLLSFILFLQKAYNGNVTIVLYDDTDKSAIKNITVGTADWHKTDLKVGLGYELEWEQVESGFDWEKIKKFRIDCWFSGAGSGDFWVDGLYFGGRRYSATREDATSQSNYGLRELVEVDEELVSDNECDLRAKALLDYFKDPAEYLVLRSTVIDYGTTPLLPADKIPVLLPNENIDDNYRMGPVEYYVDAKAQTLEITLELGKVPPFLADYLYGMRATTVTVEKLARTKLGKKGIPSGAWGGGIGAHHTGHEVGDQSGSPWPSEDDGGWDPIKGWIAPSHIGPKSDTAAIVYFRTKNKAGTSPVDHHFNPTDHEHGILGSETERWLEIWVKYLDVSAQAKLAQLNIGEEIVITSARVLQNVLADAAIITSGQFAVGRMPRDEAGKFLRTYGAGFDPMYAFLAAGDIPSLPASKITSGQFPLGRMPRGGSGYVLEAQGVSYDPMYVNPNGRYTPASHSHSHASLTGIGSNDHHAQDHNHAGETLSPDTINVNNLNVAVGVNCSNWLHADVKFENEFRITEAEKLGLSKGLAFLNPKGKVLMFLDMDGNIEISGKLKEGVAA